MLTLTVNRGGKVATLTANGDLAVKKSFLLLDRRLSFEKYMWKKLKKIEENTDTYQRGKKKETYSKTIIFVATSVSDTKPWA